MFKRHRTGLLLVHNKSISLKLLLRLKNTVTLVYQFPNFDPQVGRTHRRAGFHSPLQARCAIASFCGARLRNDTRTPHYSAFRRNETGGTTSKTSTTSSKSKSNDSERPSSSTSVMETPGAFRYLRLPGRTPEDNPKTQGVEAERVTQRLKGRRTVEDH